MKYMYIVVTEFSFSHSGNQASLYYPQTGEHDVYYDIQSGEGSDQVGLFFSSGGIYPFKSSSLTIWLIYLGFTNLHTTIHTNQ